MRRIRLIYVLTMVLSMLILMEGVAIAMGDRPQRLDYNILLITIDTLRADHLGCYGYNAVKTPNIDKLASEGVLFTQAITPVPITLPSHSSIMTGLYPVQHGVRNNGNFFLSPDAITMAELMKEHGYRTGACVGAFVLDSIFGLDQGFDFYDDNFNPGKRRINVLFNERKASEITRVGIRWLEENKDDRFFLWLHYFDPHSPYMPPFPTNLEYREHPYDGEIAYVDSCLGELFKSMHDMGLMDKTVIIFTADHGEGLGEHNEQTHAIFIYDSTLRVPLIISVPGILEKGKTVSSMVSNMDIMPTVIDLFGLRPVKGLAGKSLMPLIYGKATDIHIHPQILCESLCPELNFGWSRLEGIRTPEWKYIKAPASELYHLGKDLGETNNLLQQGREDHAKWKTALERLKQDYPFEIGESQPSQMDPETEKRLRSLGYVWTKAETDMEEDKAGADPKDNIHLMNYLDEGMGYLIIGLYDQAVEKFQKIIDSDPDNIAAYFNLACAYENKNELEKAETIFKKVIKLDPKHLDVHNHLGLIHYQREEWASAEKEFQLALDLVEYAEVYYNLSLVYNQKGEPDKAITEICKCIELDPGYSEAWNQLGNLYLARNDIQEAAKQFEKAIKLDPTHLIAHNNLGLVYSKTGRIDEAIGLFQEAVRLDPNSAEAHNNLGSLYIGQKRHDQAMSELKKALRIRPDYIKAIINLGMLHVSLNDHNEAERLFQKALSIDQNCAEAYSQLGYLFMLKQEFDKSLYNFQQMLRIKPEDPRCYYYTGKAYHALGQTDMAINAWQSALDLQPGLAGAHLNLGNAYFEAGDFQKAQKEWQLALAGRHIDISSHLVNLGMVYFQSQQYEKAIQAWQKAGELGIGNPDIHYNIALAYFKQGRYREADHELRELLRIQPDSQKAHTLLERIRQNF